MKTQGYTIKPKEKPFKGEKFKVKKLPSLSRRPSYHEAIRGMIREAKDFTELQEIADKSEQRMHLQNPFT